MLSRRGLLAAASSFALAGPAASAGPMRPFRIGFQKGGILVIARQRRTLEGRLGSLGIEVTWSEFSYGPPLLEAIRAGSLDFGATGDLPPIFAQAARASLTYVGAVPAVGSAQAILLPPESSVTTLAELKGKRLAVAKGSSAHNLAVAAIEKAGLSWSDITPVFLAPADAAAAFVHGAVDAWAIWDPFYAIAERQAGVRVLARQDEVEPQNAFFLSSASYVQDHPEILRAVLAQLAADSGWAHGHKEEAARILSQGTGVPIEIERQALSRTDFAVSPMTPGIVAQQQRVADRFRRLGLIPSAVNVADVVWRADA